MMKYRYIAFAAVLSLAFSCSLDEGELASAYELGTELHTYDVECTEGFIDLNVYSNLSGYASVVGDADWVMPENGGNFNGDGKITINYLANESFPRKAAIELLTSKGERRDTIILRQKGVITPELSLEKTSTPVYNKSGQTVVGLSTNIPWENIVATIVYAEEGEEWISDMSYDPEKGTISFTTVDNTMDDELRHANLNLSFVDGWGNVVSATLNLIQANALNKLGLPVEFQEVRNMARNAGATVDNTLEIDEKIMITGYVVSEPASGNVGENPMLTGTSVDYELTRRSAYVESLDGKYGFLLEFATPADNVLKRYDRVEILLDGAEIYRASEPERYVILGLTSESIMTATSGLRSNLPVKEKYIEDLTDDDIYTFVTLKSCEYPVRKGSLTPVHDGYTNATNLHRSSKWASLIRDVKGGSLYMYTNTTCLYRRLGRRIGYGAADISGVIVHEKYRRFNDADAGREDECGYIGRYQLRHMAWEDIIFPDSPEEGFSAILCEYRYVKTSGKNDGWILPTTGNNGAMTQTAELSKKEGYDCGGVFACRVWDYLGPVGDGTNSDFGTHKDNINGYGIIEDDGRDYRPISFESSQTNDTGKGESSAKYQLGWGSGYWTNGNAFNSWLVYFSTEGITTDHLSMQFCINNSNLNSPRFWKAEWAEGDNAPASDASWNLIGEYTSPDVVVWGMTLYSQTTGYKPVNFDLPLAMLGKKKVWIRLTPTSDAASTGIAYTDGFVGTNATNNMNYFCVRYNGQYQRAKSGSQVKVMSFNIRYPAADDTGDRAWDNRKAACINAIKDKDPDVIGFQEPQDGQQDYLRSELGKIGYTLLSTTGKEVGTTNVSSSQSGRICMAYKNEKYTVTNSGKFWLSDTPDTPSRPWDAQDQAYRMAMWVTFKVNATGEEFTVCNTHLPYITADTPQRIKATELIVDRLRKAVGEDAKVYITGDMNASWQWADERRESLRAFFNWCTWARDCADTDSYVNMSWNNWGDITNTTGRWNLDHIFCRNVTRAVKFETVNGTSYGVKIISDHYPIMFTSEL